MKVKNETIYDTRYLRSLFIKCENHEGTNHKYRDVTVRKSKKGRVHGRAWIRSRYIDMYLPEKASVRVMAQVYIHEVGHNLGLHHKDMAHLSYIDVTWLPDEIIPLKKLKSKKPKPNIIEVRANKAQAKFEEWTKKLNRAKTYVKKYQKKVKYYEKKMAASRNEKQG